jgi:hypothetical protein
VFTIDVAGFVRERFERTPPEGGTIEVVLRRGVCKLTGRVVTANGEPHRGIVSLRAGDHTAVKTDADGRFLMTALRSGPATLFAGVVRELVLTPGRNDVGTIQLPASVRVRGVVVDVDGRPVWQAKVRLHDREAGRDALRDPLMRTRGDGSFDVSVEPFRDYALRIDAEGYATAFAPIVPAPRVVLRPGGTIVVHVPEREIKNRWSVGLRDARDKWRPRDTSRDKRRVWTLTGVPAGRWEVYLTRYGEPGPHLARTCTVVAGETTVVRLD